MEDMSKTYELLSALSVLKKEYDILDRQSKTPCLISEDRIMLIEDRDKVGKQILQTVLQWNPE